VVIENRFFGSRRSGVVKKNAIMIIDFAQAAAE